MNKKVLLSIIFVLLMSSTAFASAVKTALGNEALLAAEVAPCGLVASFNDFGNNGGKVLNVTGVATNAMNWLRPDNSVQNTYEVGESVNLQVLLVSATAGFSLDCTASDNANGGWSAGIATTVKISSQAPIGSNLQLCRIGLKQVHASELLIDGQIVKAVSADGNGYEVYDIVDPINPPTDIHVKFGGARYNAGYYVEYCWMGHPLVDTGFTWLGYDATFLSEYNNDSSSTAEGYLDNSEPEISSELIACGHGTQDSASQAITDLTLMSHHRVGIANNGSKDGSCSLRIKYDETADTPRSSSLQTGWLQIVPGVESHGDGNI